ncbi:MAG: hypothetical protein VKL01_00825 [Limnothrix sp.]|uniref:hypothetical protein n=1 Tax=unclassified Limnothrix TaxID=2632864 RepID=UPI000C157D9C|nr:MULTISPECIES: hypothetical protein [unclassified Limnothrix]MEB3116879.1 hypothetical protein [Limnothrix sp.]MBD2160049.1 hypothetical protein [Limnothrix sp. FACHB-1083]MBD2190750.1 hypothetical protein [Limnothrix sp. FACHB-1088]MBD2553412.1 hypothetical protein [Limnothrix sp. FACHB-708]MBD2590452.1 hypothetical protein [Limnothrix sp. FACHB-406]
MQGWVEMYQQIAQVLGAIGGRSGRCPGLVIDSQMVRDRLSSVNTMLIDLLQSLILAASLGFLIPVAGLGILLLAIGVWVYVPVLNMIAATTLQHIILFLTVFGNGSPIQGTLVIGLACSFVCVLFDAFVFYQYRNLRREG